MDKVYINGLCVDASIGIYEWEKRIKQQVRIDVEMAWDNQPPARSDDIADTLNYKKVAKGIESLIASHRYELVETMAEDIASWVLEQFPTEWVSVTVGKPKAVTGAIEVGVNIERGKKPI